MNALKSMIAAALLATSAAVCAQAVSPAACAPDPSLYQALGGETGIAKVIDVFVQNVVADARIKEQFAKTDLSQLRLRLTEQFCVVSGGPCSYKGADMKTAHANLDITRADFNALVEDLQAAMAQERIPFGVQNELLAKLAPMHRDVITVR